MSLILFLGKRVSVKMVLPCVLTMCNFAVPLTIGTSLCGATSSAAELSHNETKRSYDLPRGDAAQTLRQFAKVSGTPILFLMEQVGGYQTNAIHGDYTPQEALDLLLAGTPLHLVQIEGQSGYLVTKRKAAGPREEVEIKARNKPNLNNATAMRKRTANLLSMLLAIFGAGYSSAEAQTNPPTDQAPATEQKANSEKLVELNPYVVTGVFQPVSKTRATTAISTLEASDMSLFAVNTAADLLINIPGVYVDTSQGVVGYTPPGGGPNITSRGLSFIVTEEDGLPVEGPGQQLEDIYSNPILRADSTLDRIEVVRGGSAAVTGANAPGGIFNYISKTGGEFLSSEVSVSYGLQGNGSLPLKRVDVNVGGPLAPGGWYFDVGGFYREDFGARDQGYRADYGGQLKANVVKKFKNGSLKIYMKYLDDHNMPDGGMKPAVNWNSPTLVPGWTNTSSLSGPPAAFQLRNGPDSYANFNAETLLNNKSKSIGFQFDADLGGGWSVTNNLKFSNNVEQRANSTAYGQNPLDDFFGPYFWGTYGMPGTYTYTDTATGSSAKVVSAGGYDFTVTSNNLPGTSALPNAGSLLSASVWWSKMNEWQDQISVNKTFGPMSFTGGVYLDYARSSNGTTDAWAVGTLTPQPRPLVVTLLTPGGQTLQVTNSQGFGAPTDGNQLTAATWKQMDLFFGHTWEIAHNWNFDWGLREEYAHIDSNASPGAGSPVITSTSNNIYSNSYTPNRPFFNVVRSIDTFAYSGALNHQFNKESSVYTRYSVAKKSPDLAFYTSLSSPSQDALTPTIPQEVKQWELGYKFAKRSSSIDITAFDSLLSKQEAIHLKSGLNQFTSGYDAYTPANRHRDIGVEVDARYYFDNGFGLRAALTWQKPTNLGSYTWTQPNGPGPISEAVLTKVNAGNRSEDIPDFMAVITPSYAKGRFLAQVQWQYVGAREANEYDAFLLPAYQQTNLTLRWRFTPRLYVTFNVNNLFDSKGVAEWGAPGDLGGLYSAEKYTRAQVQANPNAVFGILNIPATAYFIKATYTF